MSEHGENVELMAEARAYLDALDAGSAHWVKLATISTVRCSTCHERPYSVVRWKDGLAIVRAFDKGNDAVPEGTPTADEAMAVLREQDGAGVERGRQLWQKLHPQGWQRNVRKGAATFLVVPWPIDAERAERDVVSYCRCRVHSRSLKSLQFTGEQIAR